MNSMDAGVIVLQELESDCLILTQRSAHLSEHPGEICFAGGRFEEGDKDFSATALRELHEELHIEPKRVHLIKELVAERTLSGTIIHPWFATIENINPFQIDLSEVEEIVRIPIQEAKNAKNYEEMWVERFGKSFHTYRFIGPVVFGLDKEKSITQALWGATARIMRQLIER